MADLPFPLPPELAARLRSALDREGKIDRALEALGPIVDRDVVAVGAGTGQILRWTAAGARVTNVEEILGEATTTIPSGTIDTIVSTWSGFRGADPAELAESDRMLRPAGRLLVVHDYGRDDVSRLRGDRPEYGPWSRRDGPFLSSGFRVRVIHCFWTFDDLEDARRFLADAFGPTGAALGETLRRPRLSWNVAVYHRSRGGVLSPEGPGVAIAATG